MAYTVTNFKTKKELKAALEAGVKVRCYEPGLGTVPTNGTVFLEGPHAPALHTWYAEGEMKNGVLVSIK